MWCCKKRNKEEEGKQDYVCASRGNKEKAKQSIFFSVHRTCPRDEMPGRMPIIVLSARALSKARSVLVFPCEGGRHPAKDDEENSDG